MNFVRFAEPAHQIRLQKRSLRARQVSAPQTMDSTVIQGDCQRGQVVHPVRLSLARDEYGRRFLELTRPSASVPQLAQKLGAKIHVGEILQIPDALFGGLRRRAGVAHLQVDAGKIQGDHAQHLGKSDRPGQTLSRLVEFNRFLIPGEGEFAARQIVQKTNRRPDLTVAERLAIASQVDCGRLLVALGGEVPVPFLAQSRQTGRLRGRGRRRRWIPGRSPGNQPATERDKNDEPGNRPTPVHAFALGLEGSERGAWRSRSTPYGSTPRKHTRNAVRTATEKFGSFCVSCVLIRTLWFSRLPKARGNDDDGRVSHVFPSF